MNDVAAPGLYGKLASQGDFVTRRLAPAFVREWDTWLQHGMRALRTRRGDAWLGHYLAAPVWRFALAPGACGVLLPSVDRVGRYFPLTLAIVQDAPLAPTALDLAAGATAWFDALGVLALRAMCGELSVAGLNAALEALGAPVCDPGAPGDPCWIVLDSAPRACAALARSIDAHALGANTLFWTEGAAGAAPMLVLGDGLPGADVLGDMLGARP